MTLKTVSPKFCLHAIKQKLSLSVLAAVAATTLHANDVNETAPVFEAQFVQDGSSERIDYSGKLRMLSQRVVAASCYAQAGVDTDASRATLAAASAEFALITDALEFGNDDLGIIGAEERRKTLAGIHKLRELWVPVAQRATAIQDGTGTDVDVVEIAAQSVSLLDVAIRLVSQIGGQYSGQTTVLQNDALAIDIAGRQRMLAQRISKNICLISSGVNADASLAELTIAADNFENALYALRSGRPEVGIRLPPTSAISDGLDVVLRDWAIMSAIIAQVAAGQTLDNEQLGIVFNTGNALTGNMNKVVGMYSEASKMGA